MVDGLSGTREESEQVELMTNRTLRLVAGAFAAAAVAVPLYAAIATEAAPELNAGPPCLAWFGNMEDGKCLSYSNGNGIIVGPPAYYGGNSPNSGFYTGPLLPGTTIRQGVGVP
jgi:4-amino-4-deoxy-L-arabinose transferase-like glycosyltransferase